MRALVTGGTGFLGQWLLKRLVSENHEVRALVRRPNESIPTSVQQFVGDVTDSNSLTPAMKSVDVVYHLAGVVGYSRAQRKTMEDVNVGGTRNVIESVISSGRPQLVHMSSVVAIGASFKPVPLNESAEYNLSHLNLGYFETKRKAEELVKEATQSQKIRSVILNPSTIWGAGDFEKGSRKIQLLVAKGKFAVYPPGGLNIVNVESVVDALIAAPTKGRNGERYIISGENLTIRESFREIAKAAGVSPPSFPLPKWLVLAIGKIGDRLEASGKKGPLNSENAWASVLFHWYENEKAKSELGISPTPATDAIRKSIQWAMENGKI